MTIPEQYPGEPLLESDVAADPLVQFDRWFERAREVVRLPEAVALATADPTGRPSVRMVLLRGWDADGFTFHTDYDSRKAGELMVNPRGALLLHWDVLGRQIRIEGPVEKATAEESNRYFSSRPRDRQIAAHASDQSAVIDSRERLDQRVRKVEAEYAGRPVPRPPDWGGLRVRPDSFEFWQNRDDRLHDRLLYTPASGGWQIERLQP